MPEPLSLEQLAQLEALIDRRVEERLAVDPSRSVVSQSPPVSSAEVGRPSRRWLLTAGAGAAAVGVGAVLATPGEAAAANGSTLLIGNNNITTNTATATTELYSTAGGATFFAVNTTSSGVAGIYGQSGASGSGNVSATSAAVVGDTSTALFGVAGGSSTGYGVYGISSAVSGVGVYGTATSASGGYGLEGYSQHGPAGVSGSSASGIGVQGLATGPEAAVSGSNTSSATTAGAGVSGVSTNGSGVIGTSTNSVGVYGSSQTTYGVQGSSNAVAAAIRGDNFSTAINGIGLQGTASGPTGTGVFGVASGTNGDGVYGSGATGVYGYGTQIGVLADGSPTSIALGAMGSGRIYQFPQSNVGAPAYASPGLGEQARDADGQMWICVTGNAWQKVAAAAPGANGGSTNMLATPFRLYDSRTGSTDSPITPRGPIQSGAVNSFSVQVTGTPPVGGTAAQGVPAGAIGVVGTITVTNTTGSGFLVLFPAGTTAPGTSNVNMTAAGQTVASAYTAALSSGGALAIQCGGNATDFILDITGYIY